MPLLTMKELRDAVWAAQEGQPRRKTLIALISQATGCSTAAALLCETAIAHWCSVGEFARSMPVWRDLLGLSEREVDAGIKAWKALGQGRTVRSIKQSCVRVAHYDVNVAALIAALEQAIGEVLPIYKEESKSTQRPDQSGHSVPTNKDTASRLISTQRTDQSGHSVLHILNQSVPILEGSESSSSEALARDDDDEGYPLSFEKEIQDRKDSALKGMLSLGMVEAVARGFLDNHPLQAIEERLTVVNEQVRAGRVKNPAAYAYVTLANGSPPAVEPIQANNWPRRTVRGLVADPAEIVGSSEFEMCWQADAERQAMIDQSELERRVRIMNANQKAAAEDTTFAQAYIALHGDESFRTEFGAEAEAMRLYPIREYRLGES